MARSLLLLQLLLSQAGALVVLVIKAVQAAAAERRTQQRQHRHRSHASPPPATDPSTSGRAARIQLASGLFTFVAQLLALQKSGLAAHEWEAASFLGAIALLLIVLPAACPALFERHRYVYIAAARIALFAQPMVANPRGMQHVFEVRGLAGMRRAAAHLLCTCRGRAAAALLDHPVAPTRPCRRCLRSAPQGWPGNCGW